MPNAQQAAWQKSGVPSKLKVSASYATNAVSIGYVRAKLKLSASIFRSFAKLPNRYTRCFNAPTQSSGSIFWNKF